MKIQFLNHKEWGIDERQFELYFERLKEVTSVHEGILNVVFVNDAYIRALNKAYRGKDRPTDVLSFNYQAEEGQSDLVGEVYISVETAELQAKELGHSLSDELNKLFIHGFLHIHGYDHEEEADYKVMQALETKILGKRMT